MLNSNMDIIPEDRYRWIFLLLFLIVSVTESADNISLGKSAAQSSTRTTSDGAADAVDGCTNQIFSQGCCTHTAGGQSEAWWRVDLGQLSVINHIVIYYRDDFRHFLAGYELYVSNTTERTEGVLCYIDNSTSISEVKLIHTRCQMGKYGSSDCHRNCSNACSDNSCNSVSGACFHCVSGTFGSFCEHNCSVNCGSLVCEKDNGHCFNCTSGKHGDICELNCPSFCKDHLCFQNSGFCLGCIAGKYGPKCESKCFDNCKGNICIQETGYCEGCIVGKYGTKCHANCPDNCEENVCIQDSGYCKACEKGHYGNRCDIPCVENCAECRQDNGDCTACEKGYYGNRCDKPCQENCEECRQDDGNCTRCVKGYYGEMCNSPCIMNCQECNRDDGICKECSERYYGQNCSFPCGNCRTCAMHTGLCTSACFAGWTGTACAETDIKFEKGNVQSSGSSDIVGYTVLGTLLVLSLSLNVGFLIIRFRKKFGLAKSSETQSSNSPDTQNNYMGLDLQTTGGRDNEYDTIERNNPYVN